MRAGMEMTKPTNKPKQEQTKHGYTNSQQFAIEQQVRLEGIIQHHMMNTYIKYTKNPLVKEDAEQHTNIKGTKTGAVGRPSILPEKLGHN
eukprot:10021565-Heterocapsa_arctica.AAC.1